MRLLFAGMCVGSGLALGVLDRADAQEPMLTDVEIVGHVYKPIALEPTPERLEHVSLAEGFRIEKFAEGLQNVRDASGGG